MHNYTYGQIIEPNGNIRNGQYRFNKDKNNVEFILWREGHNGREKDHWNEMGLGWKDWFVPFNPEPLTEIEHSNRLEF